MTGRTVPTRIVLVHRYFPPDTPPYATILRDLAVHLGEQGHEVTVLTCQPSYSPGRVGRAPAREMIGSGVTVRRWPVITDRRSTPAKLANLVVFALRVVLTLCRMPRVDVVMAASTPPIFLALATSLGARLRRARFVYHKQDIYPEIVAAQHGLPRPVQAVLRRIDAATDRSAAAVVVLSADMEQTVRARAVPAGGVPAGGVPAGGPRIEVINNFDPWSLVATTADSEQLAPTDETPASLRMVYAGNLGRFQNIPAIAAAMLHLRDTAGVSLDVIGDGPLLPWLRDFVADNDLSAVRLHGYLPPERLAGMLRRDFDLGIVSLHPGVIRSAYPSKTLSYLRNGLPVLAVVETDSQLAEELCRRRAGWAADPAREGAIGETVRLLLAEQPGVLRGCRTRARAMYREEFSRTRQLELWSALFNSLSTRTVEPSASLEYQS